MRTLRFAYIALLVIIVPALLLTAKAHGQLLSQASGDSTMVNLAGKAAFKPGDDPVWRSKFIDEEEGWSFINIPAPWETQGYQQLNGFGWYRIRFTLPEAMRGDSLVLVMSGVDDADETFLNGSMIGKTGEFPPYRKSELHSPRVYPLPRALQEEFNLLALRVCDFGDRGGITGNIIRIVRVEDVSQVLREIVREPYKPPLLYTSNGVCVSAYNPVTATVEWMKPHIFAEIDKGLMTETVMSNLTLSVALDGYVHRLKDYEVDYTEYYQNTGIIRTVFAAGFEVFWYHPQSLGQKALVGMLRHPRGMNIEDVGALFTVDRPYWQFRDFVRDFQGERRYYFVFVYNGCCDDLAERDLVDILGEGGSENLDKISLERELLYWKDTRARAFAPPQALTPEEQSVYTQSLSLIRMAQVREPGQGEGQIVSAFAPTSRAYAVPREHLASVAALAQAGLIEEAMKGLAFIRKAGVGKYVFFDIMGNEFGVGLPYLVTPGKYYGNGIEYMWDEKEATPLSYDGMAMYVQLIQRMQDASRELFRGEGSRFHDSLFVDKYWDAVSRLSADVLLHLRDEHGMMPHDGGPFHNALDPAPGIYSAIHAAAALNIASAYAKLMDDEVRHTAYQHASVEIRRQLDSIIRSTEAQIEASSLTIIEKNLFHPLLCDGVTTGVFPPRSPATRFAMEMMESSFRIDGAPNLYMAQPDGDWFARQARPLLTLRLARAYAANLQLERAEELFAVVTSLALENYGMLPELIDPVTHNWYGGVPAIGFGAAEYILTAHDIAHLRGERRQ